MFKIEISVDVLVNGFAVSGRIEEKTTSVERSHSLFTRTYARTLEEIGDILADSLATSSLTS